ncbi:MAG: DUF523 domain-containing protein [bacterium]
MVKLCSACLLGINCKFDGQSKIYGRVLNLTKDEVLIPVCPELFGGQATPRPDAEIVGGTGEDVLNGKARVLEKDGNDVTLKFTRGAEEVLKIAKLYGIKEAILKQRSPSCGSGEISDGTFFRSHRKGDGVTTALLKKNGIKVISEEDL